MKLTKYDVFVKVVELGSLSKAADACSYSQSAVSQIVSAVEAELGGIALLRRAHAGVTLTSDGAQVYPDIRRLSQACRALEDKVCALKGIETGLIRIGVFSSASCHLLPPLLKGFCAAHPNIRFELMNGHYRQIEDWIADGTVDFGFVDLPARREFDVIPIREDRMLAVLPEQHPAAALPAVPLALLAQSPFVLLEEGTKREVMQMLERHQITPQIAFRTADDYSVMAMVENGLGVSILAELVLQKTAYRIVARPTDPPFSRKICIAMKQSVQQPMAVQCFLAYVKAQLAQEEVT